MYEYFENMETETRDKQVSRGYGSSMITVIDFEDYPCEASPEYKGVYL
jgi:hypothetical protein